MLLNPGTFLGDRYEIIEEIGTGGMSNVYKAKDHVLGRDVAVKILKEEFAEDKTFVAKFRQEAQAAAGLEHPNIVNIYDVGNEDGLYYIVMEYVQGITLKTYIEKKGHLNYKEVLSIAIQVGRGIEAAHNKGIIHRDIKPQNIIISNEGKVKVTDFGIAKATSSNTMSAEAMGSVHYISPEQARNGYVSTQSDIYSLGIVMYEMTTGRVPFDGETAVAVAIQHLQGDMVPPSQLVAGVPLAIERIIEKATQKSPERRYPKMEDLLVDLKKALMNPDEDFVQDIDPNEDEKTKVITPDEMDKIRDDAPASSELIPDDEEDEDDDKINPKMEKAITIMGIAAAVIIAIIALYLLGSFLGWFHFGSSSSSKKEETKPSTKAEETITVPDLTGMTEDEAKAALEKAGLKYELSGKESSDTVKEGLVVRQTPVAKKKVAEGTKVKVTLSSGKADQSVDVPNVVGQSESKAKSTLTGAGFKVDVSYEYSDSVASGNVISQTPSSGTANEGDTIKIVVSRGEDPNKTKMVSVPNFTKGASYDSVASALSALNLTAQRVESPNNDPAYDDGAVLSVEPVSGSQVAEGSTIKVYVNKAKEKTPPTSESTNPTDSGAGAGGAGAGGSENPSDHQQDPNQPAGNQ